MAKNNSKEYFNKDKKSKSTRGKGKNCKSRNYDKEKETEASRNSVTANNDLSWYVSNVQMLKDSCSLAFSNTLDNGVTLDPYGDKEFKLLTPGICAIKCEPTIGTLRAASESSAYTEITGNPTAAVNIAARSIYSFVRHANSGHSNYDACDMMMYLLAMDQAYMLWSYLVRIYGLARTYSYTNKYYPRTLLVALGVNNPDIVVKGLADFRYLINTMAIRMSSMAVPTIMPFFKRHLWLFQNVFLDRPGKKAQTYVYVPTAFYEYAEKTTDGRPYLARQEFTGFSSNSSSGFLNEVQDMISAILDPIIESESMGIMSGDILKAYTSSNLYGFTTIPEDYSVVPTYAPEILSQISNLVIANPEFKDIRQDVNGNIVHEIGHDWGTKIGLFETILNSLHDDVTPEDVMYATRLIALRNRANNEYVTGSEVVTGLDIYPSSTDVTVKKSINSVVLGLTETNINYSTSSVDDVIMTLSAASAFEQFPRLYVGKYDGNQSTASLKGLNPFIDIDNYTTLNYNELKKIHDVALVGMFGVPYSLTTG